MPEQSTDEDRTVLKGRLLKAVARSTEIKSCDVASKTKTEKSIKTPRIRLRMNIVKLPVPPVILRPSLQGLEHSKSCFAQPRSREVTFFQGYCCFSLDLYQFGAHHAHLL